MTDTVMPHWLRKRAELTPDRVAVETFEAAVTFRELNESSRNLAANLQAYGIKEGDRVALLMGNSLAMIQSYHALAYLGAIAVPLNTRLTPAEIAWQLEDSGASLLLHDGSKLDSVHGLEPRRTDVRDVRDWISTPARHPGRLKKTIRLDEPHTIIYTSGTTGRPKGVILSHGNHWWSAVGSALNLGVNFDDKWLAAVPLFHVSGLSILMKSVIYGMPVFLQERFDAKAVNEAIFSRRVTIVSVVTAMMTKLLDDLGDQAYPAWFRCMLLGGGPAPMPLLEKAKAKGIPVFQTYGLSETASQIVTLAPEYMMEKIGSAGKPLFPAEIKIVDDRGKERRPGEEGEIVVKGPNVTKGYWQRPEATAEAWRDGWFHTGDIGVLDDDGFLYVLDRRKDLIISGGENVYPAEVEAALVGHPLIEEAGVVGAVDDVWGHVPAAFIVTKNGAKLAAEDVEAFCRNRLAGYKVPKHVFFVDRLPRNASGKLLRRKLVERLPSELRTGVDG